MALIYLFRITCSLSFATSFNVCLLHWARARCLLTHDADTTTWNWSQIYWHISSWSESGLSASQRKNWHSSKLSSFQSGPGFTSSRYGRPLSLRHQFVHSTARTVVPTVFAISWCFQLSSSRAPIYTSVDRGSRGTIIVWRMVMLIDLWKYWMKYRDRYYIYFITYSS